ncbi:germin-like protein [Musa troglodytarum]|uniref:Germin-like protein n=1 Tax=Musa troglodytarum TaxID=320322 RepID=A0A9E7FQV0_9LILI|nr:germin-like protein [Musa troglodytarum]
MAAKILLIALLAMASSLAMASDPSPLQDFCAIVSRHQVIPSIQEVTEWPPKCFSLFSSPWLPLLQWLLILVNFKTSVSQIRTLKDPMVVKADDFSLSGLDMPGDTGNKFGFNVTQANVNQIPGLNTLGISMVRIDYVPKGLNPPHTHPRATEILTVIEGQLLVGFVTSNTDNRLFTKMLNKGDVFVFPQGLIHFQFNPGYTNTFAIGALSSQNPGTITIADAVFGSNPPISDEILAKAFQVDKKLIDWLQAEFSKKN